MKKILILASFLALAPFAKGQLLLEALDAPDAVVLPPGVSFQSGEHWIVSVKDANYLPFEKANAPLTGGWTRDSGASKDPLIHFPGIITTAGEEVEVPITVTSAVTLPAGNSRVVVPADKTEDGVSRTLVLEWENTQLTTTTKTVKMKLRSEGGNLNIMLLDLLKGLGQNGKGVNLATFTLPMATGSTGNPATVGINVIPGIPDSAYGKVYGDGNKYHNLVYYPGGLTPSGKLMLSTDLGQTGLDPNKAGFDPYRKGTDGYLYAYGKGNDGHEVFVDGYFLFGVQSDDAYIVPTNPYEQDELNPCPTGYEPIRYDDFLTVAYTLPYLTHDVSTGTNTSSNVPNWSANPIPRSTWYDNNAQSRRVYEAAVAYRRTRTKYDQSDRWFLNRDGKEYDTSRWVVDSSSKNGADPALMRCVSK